MNDAFGRLIPKGSEGFPGLVWCDLYNISACQFTEANKQVNMIALFKAHFSQLQSQFAF